jgi:hypothetical protein
MRKELTPHQIELIKKPLPAEAVSKHPTKGYLSTIKVIYITERLNEVFGFGAWSIKTDMVGSIIKDEIKKGDKVRIEYTALLKTTFTIPEYEIYYEVIASSTNDDMGDAAKGAVTDAISKIASWIGIGQDVYKGMQDEAIQVYERKKEEEELAGLISALQSLHTADEVKAFAENLTENIRKSPAFRSAAKVRLEQIKQEANNNQ